MRVSRMLIAAAVAASPAAAAAQDWRQAREFELVVSSYDLQPSAIRLRAGEPVRLRLINRSGQTHRLSGADFFGSARVRNRDRESVAGGGVSVEPGQTRELLLAPAPGRYRLRSSNFLYRLLGMSSEILVE